ncbi:MAG: glycosyltransferase [Leptolyngbya sp. SIO4C5]|nr:glycosyltransferase [Leptolyngbya sp. SIO4C5]
MIFVTVAIPTYNGEKRLSQVLDCLLQQVNLENISWEVLVVDNNSTDATAKITRRYQQTWPESSNLQYCFAARQGAAFARQKAVESASGEVIAFLDDDNLPAENWVEQVYQFAVAHPQAGAFGSRIHACFETEPPQQISENIAPFLAIVNRGEDPHQYRVSQRVLPPGAGLAVRKQAWVESVPDNLFLNYLGQYSSANTASEDLEVLIHIQKVGWEIWHNPDMVVYHQISQERLQEQNVLMLLRRIGLSRFYVRMLRYPLWQRPFLGLLHFLLDIAKLLVHYLTLPFDQQRSHFERLCQREYLLTSLLSPFFLVKKYQSERRVRQNRKRNAPNYEFWLSKISRAFEDQLFCLFLQQIEPVSNSQPELKLAEVLLRLQFDENNSGTVSATDFMPTAVSFSLTKVIDRWVIEEFARWLAALKLTPSDRHYQVVPTLYLINLSAASIEDEQFSNFLASLLEYYPYLANRVCFELPESALLANLDQAVRFIQAVQALNFAVAVDNASDFLQLKKLTQRVSIDYLKVDTAHLESAYPDLLALSYQKAHPQIIAMRLENTASTDKIRDLGILLRHAE